MVLVVGLLFVPSQLVLMILIVVVITYVQVEPAAMIWGIHVHRALSVVQDSAILPMILINVNVMVIVIVMMEIHVQMIYVTNRILIHVIANIHQNVQEIHPLVWVVPAINALLTPIAAVLLLIV